ncbi:P-type ATPase, partial [Staphylococcus hominis]|uniref:P-type ATPase n=1 Tax=Staphylococcus hominis TaxID=1290 RepID=UPI0021B54761
MKDDGRETMVGVENVEVGERLVVKGGEKMGVDGKVIKGRRTVDECMVSGEWMGIDKRVDNE